MLLFHLVFFFHSRTECVLTELYSLPESFNLIHLSWICKCVWLRASQHEPIENWLCFQRFALSDKHYSTICARTSACFGTSPLLLIRHCLKSDKYHYLWFCIWRKNKQKMSYKKLCNHSPHILPLSVLACCLEFFWEHTRTFAKVSLTIEWLLQQCRLYHNLMTFLHLNLYWY